MKRRTIGASVLTLGLVLGLLPTRPAQAVIRPAKGSGMSAALQRDLGLTPGAAVSRLARDEAAARRADQLRGALAGDFGGAWLDPGDQHLVVATTNPARVAQVRAAGAEPRLVTHGERGLAAIVARLDARPTPTGIISWYADNAADVVVVEADPVSAAAPFVAGLTGVVVRPGTRATLQYSLRGGDDYTTSGLMHCTTGFTVTKPVAGTDPVGFVTAGHCGGPDQLATGHNGVALGTVRGSDFPGTDYGWVQTTANWTPKAWVGRQDGTNTNVHGSQEAAVGAAVCRSGHVTGWRCGTILSKNTTVVFPEGTVHGLTRTSVCGQPGDSGAPYLAGVQAQGVHTGSSCSTGVGYMQPLAPILAAYGLSLVVSAAPTITSLICEYMGNRIYQCHVVYAASIGASIRWTVNGVAQPALADQPHVTGSCALGRGVSVTVTVLNSAGTATRSDFVHCGGEPH